MLGIIFARAFDLMRRHLAASLFEASRLALLCINPGISAWALSRM
jgi:hypothetical protein